MRHALVLTLWFCTFTSLALAQNPPAGEETPPPEAPKVPAVAPPEAQGAREVPPEGNTFEARVHNRLEEYEKRHQQREEKMASYDKVSGTDPGLGRFTDPRKAQVELSDELDRERTSQGLADDYAAQARAVEAKEKSLEEFVAKRRQVVDDLSAKQEGAVHRPDLEVALANLARLPDSAETQAQMREINRRLSEAEFKERQLPGQQKQTQQELADSAEVLARLKALVQTYQKEAKAFRADALSAHDNRLRLADKIEYFVVRAQAEDELEQGHKAIDSAHHLPPSPEVDNTLNGSKAEAKPNNDLQRLKECLQKSSDVKGCREKIPLDRQE